MGVKRPAEDDEGDEGTSKAKVANLKKLEEEAKQHERDNPQQGTSRQMQGTYGRKLHMCSLRG